MVMFDIKDINHSNDILSFFFNSFILNLGPCVDYALQNVRNRKDMKDGGWNVDGAPHHDNMYAANCGGYKTFWGYKRGWAAGLIEATFKGSGRGTLDFGSCYKRGGITKVYLNGIPIALAHTNLQSKVISFEYKRGDVLKITEEKTGIMKINSFKLEDCKKEGNIAF